MTDLRTFTALQARVYEFLEKQDDATLNAIANGEIQLATVAAGDISGPAPADLTAPPSRDPAQVARVLPTLASEDERRIYLERTGFTGDELRAVAKALRLKRYSRLKVDNLVTMLVTQGPAQPAARPKAPQAPPVVPPPAAEPPATEPPATEPPATVPAVEAVKPDADMAAIALRLRETETVDEGAAYLREQHLDKDGLLAVATALGLTRVNNLRQSELEKRVLKQAIGARRKFEGLRKW